MKITKTSLSVIAAIAILVGCSQEPATERAKECLERWSTLIQTGQYNLASLEANAALKIIYEAHHQRDEHDSILFSNALWASGVSYWGMNRWDSACYRFNAAIDADSSIPMRVSSFVKFQRECCNLAHAHLSDYLYSSISDAFDRAGYEFQFLVGQRMMPYAEFLNLSLDNKIKVCNKLGQSMNIQQYVWVMALQEWLPVDAKVATTIAAY